MLLPSFQRFSRKESLCVYTPGSTLAPGSYWPTLSYSRGQIFVGAGVWAKWHKWIRQSPFLWRQESMVWSLSCEPWLYRLPILSPSPVVQDAHLLHSWALSWSCWHIIVLEIHKSPFLTQRCIQSWLPFACTAAVLLPTKAFQSQCFTISFPKSSWIFLSSAWDLAHCRFSSDFAHLLCLNPLADLGKGGFPWQLLPRTRMSKG